MGKNKKAKIIFTLIVAIIIILILSIWYRAYGEEITKTIGTNVSATFNNETGELIIRSTSGKGTIDQNMFRDFANEIRKSNVERITFTNSVYLKDSLDGTGFFSSFTNLIRINQISNLDTSKMTSMSNMFLGCVRLDALDLTTFNTSQVTNMNSMFSDCTSLNTLNLENFNTSKVTNMRSMFNGCTSLNTLNLGNFDTSQVTNMASMFSNCRALTNIQVNRWNTSKVTDMNEMFAYCKSLDSLNLDNFNTSQVTNMASMFSNCIALTNIQMNGWDTLKVTDMNNMFNGCTSLKTIKARNWKVSSYTATNIFNAKVPTVTSIDVTNWDLSNATTLENMFNGCTSLTSIIGLNTWNTISIKNMGSMFNGCSSLENIDGISSFNTRNVTNMGSMFNGCSSLTSISISNWNTINVINMDSMFNGCSSLANINVSNWDTRNVTSMNSMFNGCSKLTTLNLSNFNTSKVTTIESMFSGCSLLENIQMNGWNTLKVTDINNIFKGCTALNSIETRNWKVTDYTASIFDRKIPTVKTIDVSGWDLSNVTTLENVFRGCNALTGITGLNTWNTINITNMGHMFYGDKELTNVGGLGYWNTTNVISMNDMFSGCNKLTSVDVLSNWDLSNVKNMDRMFQDCKNIQNVMMNGREIIQISSMNQMFLGCSKLRSVELVGFNTQSLIGSSEMFSGCTVLNTLKLPNWNIRTENIKKVIESIKSSNIDYLDARNWNIQDTSIESLFQDCTRLNRIDVINWKTTSVNNMSNTFKNCNSLTIINGIETWNTTNVISMNGMFENCNRLTNLELSNFNTSKVTDMTAMFSNCNSLTNLDLSNFNTSKVTKSDNMFKGCNLLETINLRNFDIRNMNIDLTDSNLLEQIYTPKSYSSNSTFILPANYYYNNNDNYDEKVYTGQVRLTSSIHLKKGYAIFYNANGGTGEMEPQAKRPDMSIRIKRNQFTPPTYKYFDGWYTNADATGTRYSESEYYSKNETITLYAKWEPIKANYTILHYKQTAILNEYELVQTEAYRGNVGTIATAKYYTDQYFKENPTYPGTKVSGEILMDGSLQLVLYYDRRDYKLDLVTNGGKINSGNLTFYQYGVMTVLPKDVTKDEHIFEGWYENVNGEEIRRTEVPVGVIGDKTYYAKWTPKTYKVTLNPNGGSIREENITSYTYGEGATLPTDVRRRNYAFEGWYENIEGTGNRVRTITTTDTGDKTYYAKWKKGAYTITLNTNGGTINSGDVTSYEYGEGATLPTDVTKPGYTFKGWYENSDLIGPMITVISKTDTGEKKYYAKWEATVYSIKLNLNGGTIIEGNVQTYTPGQEITLPTKVEKEGYIFEGWYKNSNCAPSKG